MSTPVEQAVKFFDSGFNCGQAVFAAFAAGLDQSTALKIATGLGGGLGRAGEVCGAVNGAVLAIGLRCGRGTFKDTAARDRTYELTAEFLRRFKEAHGAVDCRDLLGLDLSKPGDYQLAIERGLFANLCPRLVRDAAAILTELLPEASE